MMTTMGWYNYTDALPVYILGLPQTPELYVKIYKLTLRAPYPDRGALQLSQAKGPNPISGPLLLYSSIQITRDKHKIVSQPCLDAYHFPQVPTASEQLVALKRDPSAEELCCTTYELQLTVPPENGVK